jgi:multidrug efflux pump
VTIPISLIGVCFFLFALGFSINLLSLLAMVLAIGLVVDDAIVVLENIHRHIEEGLRPMDAAFKGMKEITGSIIAMTITLAAVFAPLGFTGGLTGALFREFAFTLAGAVIISGVAALTISPMMCSRMLKHGEATRFQKFIDRTFSRVEKWYHRRVTNSLNYRGITLMIVIALMGLTGFLFMNTSSELAPEEDSGALFSMFQAPQYATSAYTNLYAEQIDELTKDLPEQKTRFQIVGMDGGTTPFAEADSGRPDKSSEQGGWRAGIRLRSTIASGHRRWSADLDCTAVNRSGGHGFRTGRRDQERSAGFGTVHHRAELAVLQRTGNDDHHRP